MSRDRLHRRGRVAAFEEQSSGRLNNRCPSEACPCLASLAAHRCETSTLEMRGRLSYAGSSDENDNSRPAAEGEGRANPLRQGILSGTAIMSATSNLPVRVAVVDGLDALQALGHPLRVQILAALRRPASAAAVARLVGEARQKVNYHLKELERVGLVRPVEQRLVGNLVETLFQSIASSFVLGDEALWTDPRRAQAMRDQQSLERLVEVGRRLHRDAAALLDRAAFDGEEIPSAALEVDLRLASDADRAAFMRDVINAIKPVLDRYGRRDGSPHRVALAAYPHPEEEQ